MVSYNERSIMQKILFAIIAVFINHIVFANSLGGNPTNGYCQTVDGSACGWDANSSSSQKIYKVPDRWGAIYLNPANAAIGYSENNTKGFHSANKEALASCIKAGGGKNPIGKSGKGCQLINEYRNTCGAIAIGGVAGNGGYGSSTDSYLKRAEEKALAECGKQSDTCSIKYSGCSRHPDYRY